MALPPNHATPGARNIRAIGNAGPAAFGVTHSPPLPQAGENVVVTCHATDPDGISAIRLKYRIESGSAVVTPALFSSVAMLDTGTGGDAVAGDGIYTATLPGQAANGTISFYVEAVDSRNATNLFPQNVFPPA